MKQRSRKPKYKRKPSAPEAVESGQPATALAVSDTPLSGRAPRWHYFIFLLIPLVLWLVNPNWMFQNLGHMDPWFYFGNFQHFPRIQNVYPAYHGERMTWIAPGWVLVRVFGPIAGVELLHCLTFVTSLLCLHYLTSRLIHWRTAFLCTVLLGCHPLFVGANGWDYLDGASIMYLFLSLAMLLRASDESHSRIPLLLSSIAWAALVFTYLAWAVFTPAYLGLSFYLVDRHQPVFRRAVSIVSVMLAGLVIMTGVMWALFRGMGGHGFFFELNLRTAISVSKLQSNPWLPADWYRDARWLVFPIFAFLTCSAALVVSRLQPARFTKRQVAFLWFYWYCFVVMVVMTIRPTRLLGFDYFASILIPGVFLTLGIALAQVPRQTTAVWLYAVPAGAALICLTPLSRPNLFRAAVHWQFALVIGFALLLAVCMRGLRPASTTAWFVTVICLCILSFGLTPNYPGVAWRMDYKGSEISARVAQAIQLISRSLPVDRYPVLWFNNDDDPLTSEYRGIWCSLQAPSPSMLHFPRVDKDIRYKTGTRLTVLTEQRDVVAAASYLLGRAGTGVALAGQDRVSLGDTSYWLTHLDVLPPGLGGLRNSLHPVDGPELAGLSWNRVSKDEEGLYRFPPVALPEPGVYQFEARYRLSEGDLEFGAVKEGRADWLERSGPPQMENGGSVRWFRLAVKQRMPVTLAIRVGPSGKASRFTAPPKLVVFKDTTATSPDTFSFFVEKGRPSGE